MALSVHSHGKPYILLFACFIAFTLGFLFMPSAHADMGPKPSVTVKFDNMDDTLCYVTLLSAHKSSGPFSAWDDETFANEYDNEIYEYLDGGERIWRAFINYTDTDGYYYLQCHSRVDEIKEFSWTYFPPSPFKILLYYPDTDTYKVSGIIERYAFHSYYSVDILNGYDEVTQHLIAENSYNFLYEFLWLGIRILLTVIIELIIARLFRLCTKKELLTILFVNIVTQIALNIVLNVLNLYMGEWALLWYIPLEIGIFAVESLAYVMLLRKRKQPSQSSGYYVLYSFCANLISFAVGAIMAVFTSGLF